MNFSENDIFAKVKPGEKRKFDNSSNILQMCMGNVKRNYVVRLPRFQKIFKYFFEYVFTYNMSCFIVLNPYCFMKTKDRIAKSKYFEA